MRHVLLFGQPNAGKTTLFNHLTKSNQSAINYPGSTVDIATGQLIGHPEITIVDLPGVHSFMPESDDERLSLMGLSQLHTIVRSAFKTPDLIVMVMDATQRSRHLAMAKRLIDSGYAVIVIFTMMDQAHTDGVDIDHVKLSKEIGASVFKVNARNPKSLDDIITGISINSVPCGRFMDLKPFHVNDMVDAYEWAKVVMTQCEMITPSSKSIDFDRYLLHPIYGYIIFFGVMTSFFAIIFFIGAPFMDAIDRSFGWLIDWTKQAIPTPLGAFIGDGLLAGIGGVLVFLPQIALLFFGMGLLENSGYLARSAALIDRPFSRLGLNGRSFVPLLSGCACAIPAILATRTIANRRVRLLTILVIPLMQCSARLPVYGLLLGLLIDSAWKSGLFLTGIYAASILISCILLGIAGKFMPKSHASLDSFMIQLPRWRLPIWQHLAKHVMQQSNQFIVGAGPMIVGITIALWALSSLPSTDASFLMHIGQWIGPLFEPMGVDWRVGIAIILSFAAREVFVSALAIMLHMSDVDASSLLDLAHVTFDGTNDLMFTTGSILGLIAFFMIAMQCGATVAVVKKETGSMRLALGQLMGFILLAYGCAVLLNYLF